MRATRLLLPVLIVAAAHAAIDWHTTTPLPRNSWRHACAANSGWLYFLGGGTGPYADCHSARILATGELGDWTATTSLPVALGWFSADATEDHVYACGGWNTGGLTNSVYYAALDTAGGIGAWTASEALPSRLYTQAAVIADSCLYLVGGATGVGSPVVADVIYARIQPDGSPGTWTATSSLPLPLRIMGVVRCDSFLYTVGGRDASQLPHNGVYYARINPDGSLGSWSATTSLSEALDGNSCAAVGGVIYTVGGRTSSVIGTVYSAPVLPGGGVGTWTVETALPAPRWASDGLAAGGRLYVPGGYTSTAQDDVYYSSQLTGVEELPTAPPVALAVRPVPVRGRGELRLDVARPGRVSVRVVDCAGRVRFRQSSSSPAGTWTIRLPGLEPGVYAGIVETPGGGATCRFVVLGD